MDLRKSPIRRFGFITSVTMALCLLQSWAGDQTLEAQGIFIQIAGGRQADIGNYKQLKDIYERQRAAAKNRIIAQLNDIEKACDLSAEQLERLGVAGKGAVNSVAKKIQKELETAAKTQGVKFKLGDPPEDKEDATDEGGLVARGGLIIQINNVRNGKPKFLVEAEPIWKKSIKKSLNDEQLKKLETWRSDRKKRIRKAAVDHLIAKADLKMFLSSQQCEKLTAFVDEKYGEPLAKKINATSDRNGIIIVAPLQQWATDMMVDDALKEILSKPQLEIWKTEFQKALDSL